MNCAQCKKCIKDFLNDSLNSKQTIEFLDHVNSCDDCMEELSVEFLVTEGLKRLDSATSFNLENELDEKIKNAYKKAKFYKQFSIVSVIVTVIIAFLLGLFLSTLFSY